MCPAIIINICPALQKSLPLHDGWFTYLSSLLWMFGSVRCCGLPCTWERKLWLVKTVLPPCCTLNQLLFSPNPFIFVLSSHYFIFCVTSNNLLLLVITLSPYIVVISYYVTLTSSLVPLSHIIASYPIHYSHNVHDHLVPLCCCFVLFSIFQ